MSELRERQKALARASILEALADLVAETRHLDFSMQEVAERAGVSPRTVYNHFPSREDLLDALLTHFNDRMIELGGVMIADVTSFDDLLAALPVNFRIFDEMAPLTEAWVQLGVVSRPAVEDHDHRTERMVELIGAELPGVDEDARRLVALTVRHLFTHRSWHALTHDLGLDVEEAIAVIDWSARTLLAQARAGSLPSTGAS